ncbi:WGR domain-containing protein [Crinalium epipsammum PCC 9333]|uniref:WGR domain-containing protein n=2 Tax=Crinalium TaxID=241421 RepID=K9VUF3_9CYAN|nr:WGR domain-containing protein [Crinalium epipsammum PCC 9333]
MANIISRICLECRNDATNTNKFWKAEINADNCQLTTTWGRIGTKGQSKSHQFYNVIDAEFKLKQLKMEKLNKGYTELKQPSSPKKSTANVKTVNQVKTDTNLAQVNAALLLLNVIQPYVRGADFNNLSYAGMLKDLAELVPFLQINPNPQKAFADVVSLEDARRRLQLKLAALQ